MGLRVNAICFDCARPARLARFWAAALGYRIRPYTDEDLAALRAAGIDDVEDDPTVAVDGPNGETTLWFGKVPEGKVAKNRVHLDLMPDTSMGEEVDRLVGLGASVFREHEEDGIRWTVMLDLEANEFCVQSPR
jgi:glyoxalase superfamily protein